MASILCSCVVCKQVKSVKGIHSHFIVAHTDRGKARLQAASKKGTDTRILAVGQQTVGEIAYSKSPSVCKCCSKSLPYERRHNQFCDRSCAAKFNNKSGIQYVSRICPACNESFDQPNSKCMRRTCSSECYAAIKKPRRVVVRTKPKVKRVRLTVSKFRRWPNTPHEYSRIYRCSCCQKYVSYRITKYCKECAPNVEMYRQRCKFQFNVFHYPEEFDLQLIADHGWYSPGGKRSRGAKNVEGVSRDHRFSVSDAYKLKLDPAMVAHPANCKLLLQLDNVSKGASSEFTLEELSARIQEWDRKYGVQPQRDRESC